jgi:membrane protein required for colicin V production
MHWLDIIILIVLGIGAAMGFCSGLLWQIARVVSLALSLYAAIMANASVTDWLGEQWKDVTPAANCIVAFIGVFLLVYLILYLITRLLHKAIKASKLETLDRLLGALLGAAKMAAVMACICGVMVALDLQIFKDWFDHATLPPYFAKGSDAAVHWIPQAYRDRANDGVQQVRDQVQRKITDAAVDTLKK